MSEQHADMPPSPRWGGAQPVTAPTRNALAIWSWVDLTRHVLCGLASGGAAAVLGALLGPDLAGMAGSNPPHPAQAALLFCWALPLATGLCLLEGEPARALPPWLRGLGRALLAAAGGGALLALLWLLPIAPDWRARYGHFALWVSLCLIAGLASWFGFPRTRHAAQGAVASILAGFVIALLAEHVVALTAGIGGLLGPVVRQFALLPAAGMVLGFAHGFVREVAKTEWLLVVYGDCPGRLYPLYGTPVTLGAGPESLVVVDAGGGVRGCHALITPGKDGAWIKACEGDGLVFLRNTRIFVSELCDGDEIQIGETMLRYYRIQT